MNPATSLPAANARQLCIVVPTFNERDNVAELSKRLDATLSDISWEVIFVDDDSPDRTWEAVRQLAQTDPRIRCIHRIGRRGLSGACIEGILASSAPFVAVMDADLQHDETQLPKMLALLQGGEAELAVGSRYVTGGSASGLSSGARAGGSKFATEIAKRLLHIDIADPMSGFFMLRRDRFEQLAPQLSTQGFKILLDLVATAKGSLRTVEVPYTFGSRLHGESKLDSMVVMDFLGLVLAKLTHDVVSLRFLLFAMVGATGLVVHFVTLFIALQLGFEFAIAQAIAATVAMTGNFLLNNWLTYRDKRLKGFAVVRGLLLFYLVCSVGLLANVGVAFSVYDQEPIWWLAGAAGALMGVVWNYGVSSMFVWRAR
ncbi:MAG: glycosyltransferase family 2 protein [Xanthobacteraceae bacterium]|nr:glycosyltransferase family 2 protein [Xanthobacteraceae bacterium]